MYFGYFYSFFIRQFFFFLKLLWYGCFGLPWWLRGKDFACRAGDPPRSRFDPCIWKIFWRRAWQPTPVFLPGESHGQRSLVDYSPQGVYMIVWQCRVSFRCTAKWISYMYSHDPLFWISFPSGPLQSSEQSSLSFTEGFHSLLVLYIVPYVWQSQSPN